MRKLISALGLCLSLLVCAVVATFPSSAQQSLNVVFAWGDSITAGSWSPWGPPDHSPDLYPTLTGNPKIKAYNVAITGANLFTADSFIPRTDILWRPGSHLTSLIGRNDLVIAGRTTAEIITHYQTWLTARKAIGWKLGCITLLPNTVAASYAGYEADRQTLNTAIRTWVPTYCDYVIDFAADPTLGPEAAASNTLYYPDGVHLSTLAHTIFGTGPYNTALALNFPTTAMKKQPLPWMTADNDNFQAAMLRRAAN